MSAPARRLLLLALAALLLAGCGEKPGDKAAEPKNLFARTDRAPRSILVAGDSLSVSLGEQLERGLAGSGVTFVREGTPSSGLTRPELKDWARRMQELAARQAPDLVVVMLGANDVMPVEAKGGVRVPFGAAAWSEAYAAKAKALVAACRQANPEARIFWVGAPAMGNPVLNEGVRRVNATLAALCARERGCAYIDAFGPFTDGEDRYARYARDAAGETVPIRTADGVHLTEPGARLLAGVVLEALVRQAGLVPTPVAAEIIAASRDLAPVADVPAGRAGEPAEPARLYLVKKGDTFDGIARHLHATPEALKSANPGVNPRRLSPGQRLHAPVPR